MESLKEWATVIKALEKGDQTVILRKGGILETTSGFKLEAKKFLLFPTFEHQGKENIKPQFQHYLDLVKKSLPPEGRNCISSYAQVIDEADVFSEEKIKKLANFHIWSDSYIEQRLQWKPEKPMKALLLRVFKIPGIEIPLKSEYQGCKSWININEEITNGESVLGNEELNSKLKQFKEIIN